MKNFQFPKTFVANGVTFNKIRNEKHLSEINERTHEIKHITESEIKGVPTFGYYNYHAYYSKKNVEIDPMIVEEFDMMLLGILCSNGII